MKMTKDTDTSMKSSMSAWANVPMFGDVGDIGVFVMMALQVIFAPYTKVEESFNMQALHDIVYHGTNLSAYDHLEFPGVVPRTFLGPLTVHVFLLPISVLQELITGPQNKFAGQIKTRLALGILVFVALRRYKKAVARIYGKSAGLWLMLITASQFHFTFYMSRTLPNTFALIIVLIALEAWLEQKKRWLGLCACATLILRTELVLLFAPMLIVDYYKEKDKKSVTSFVTSVLKHGVPAGIICLVLTVVVDSYFWQRWLWPEGEVFYFNAILNKSSQYGTSPYLWYFYSALPRCLLATTLLVPMALRLDMRTRALLFPVVVFLLLFSILPHKELRFIIYVVPVLNTLAAVTCAQWWQNRHKSRLRTLLALVAAGHLFLNAISCAGLVYISQYNYPGGYAIKALHEIIPKDQAVHVHLANAACQTGVTRFTQLNDDWIYNKTEGLEPGRVLLSFTHLIIEFSGDDSKELDIYKTTHKHLGSVWGFAGLNFNITQGIWDYKPVSMKLEPKLAILKRTEDVISLL